MAYIPREHDIMCGQLMGFFNNHIGNRRFRKLVDFHIDERVFDLAEIRCESIMHILRNSGYRFVQITNDGKPEPVLPCESLRMIQATLFQQVRFYSEHLQLNLKTRQELMDEHVDLMSYVESVVPSPDDMNLKTRRRAEAQRIQNQIQTASRENEKMGNGRKGESNQAAGMGKHGDSTYPTATNEESTASMLATLGSLRSFDVCLGGKGIAFSHHVGNRRFQHLLNSYAQAFNKATTEWEKLDVRDHIMGRLEKCGYRFVRIEGTGNLTVLSYATVRRKLFGMLRRICQQEKKSTQNARQQDLGLAPKLKDQFDIQRDQEQPSKKRARYVTAINDIVVPTMQNGILPLKGYWKFFPLPELGNKVDLGGTPSGWKLRLEPIAFEAECIMLEVPSVEKSAGDDSALNS